MNLRFLRDDVLEHGPDLRRWPRERQIAAAVALLREDETCRERGGPQWLGDMLAEAVSSAAWRRYVVLALSASDPMESATYALAALRHAVTCISLDWLTEKARELEPMWLAEREAEEYVSELERRADAAREAALWQEPDSGAGDTP